MNNTTSAASGTIDPQEHVDAIYKAATLIREYADVLKECHCRTPGDWCGDEDARESYETALAAAAAVETAAEAFIDVQTERDELLAAFMSERTEGVLTMVEKP